MHGLYRWFALVQYTFLEMLIRCVNAEQGYSVLHEKILSKAILSWGKK
jgi:hypothetical protein